MSLDEVMLIKQRATGSKEEWDKYVASGGPVFPLPTEPPQEGKLRFETKDSGQRLVNPSGMVRDVATDKIDYSLVFDGPMLIRWVELLDRGAKKYNKRNWMLANSDEELARARESLVRHFFQYLEGQLDEDHAAAIFFNINEIEYIKGRLADEPDERATKRTNG